MIEIDEGIVDVVDAATQQVIWQGVAVQAVTQEKQQNLQQTVNQTIQAVFAEFPLPPAENRTPSRAY